LYLFDIAKRESPDLILYGIHEVAGICNSFQGLIILPFKLLYTLIVSQETQNFDAIVEIESQDFIL
jgi:hypothetical protein